MVREAYIGLSKCVYCGKIHQHVFFDDGGYEPWGNSQDCLCTPDEDGKKYEMLPGYMTLDEWLAFLKETRRETNAESN